MAEEEKPTLAKLKQLISEFLLLGDDGVVDVIMATVIANRLDNDAVWLMLTGPSSSGKTELVAPLSDLPFIIPISDLTVNTFASGYKMGGGKQSSLLLQYQSGIMVFKDFTSILSKGRESRDIILGQLREIYEGAYTKHTGTGEQISWKGKMGAIGASTKSIYHTLAESTEMGTRFIYYQVRQPDRFDAAMRAHKNAKKSTEMRALLKEEYKRYITYVLDEVTDSSVEYDPSDEVVEEMLRVADFASLARSPVHVDFKSGLVDSEVDKEMPGRIVKQLIGLASAFKSMNLIENKNTMFGPNQEPSDEITDHQRQVLYRCAYDSIPNMRRLVLRLLASYRGGINTAGAAVALNLPTDSVKKYLYQVNAIGLCDRRKENGNKGDLWVMKNEHYRKVVCIVEGISVQDMQLIRKEEDAPDDTMSWDEIMEMKKEDAEDELFTPAFDDEDAPPERRRLL